MVKLRKLLSRMSRQSLVGCVVKSTLAGITVRIAALR